MLSGSPATLAFGSYMKARDIRPGIREALAEMRVAPMFRHYSPDDVASTTVDFVAGKSDA
jgi:hypothetical protein